MGKFSICCSVTTPWIVDCSVFNVMAAPSTVMTVVVAPTSRVTETCGDVTNLDGSREFHGL